MANITAIAVVTSFMAVMLPTLDSLYKTPLLRRLFAPISNEPGNNRLRRVYPRLRNLRKWLRCELMTMYLRDVLRVTTVITYQ